jgi:hypothetical protein
MGDDLISSMQVSLSIITISIHFSQSTSLPNEFILSLLGLVVACSKRFAPVPEWYEQEYSTGVFRRGEC